MIYLVYFWHSEKLKLFQTKRRVQHIPACIYFLRVYNGGIRTTSETVSKLILKTSERYHRCPSGVFFFSLWKDLTHRSNFSIVDYEQVNADWLISLWCILNTEQNWRRVKLDQYRVQHKAFDKETISKFVFQYWTNLSKLINFHSP